MQGAFGEVRLVQKLDTGHVYAMKVDFVIAVIIIIVVVVIVCHHRFIIIILSTVDPYRHCTYP